MKFKINKKPQKRLSPFKKKIIVVFAILCIAMVVGFLVSYGTPIEMVFSDDNSPRGDGSNSLLALASVVFSGLIFLINYMD